MSSSHAEHNTKKTLKLTRSLILIVSIFLGLYLPAVIGNVLHLFIPYPWYYKLLDFFVLCFYINNWINPVICFYKVKDFQNAFCTLVPVLRRLLGAKMDEEHSQTRSTQDDRVDQGNKRNLHANVTITDHV